MAIVLEHGKFYLNPPPEFWWIGRKMKCKCGCVFELEIKDKPQYDGNSQQQNPRFDTACLECGSTDVTERRIVAPSPKKPDDTHLPW